MYTLNDFDYTLPETLIAQFPKKNRTESRLMVVGNEHNVDTHFSAIVDFVSPDDLIIFNDTRVIPARLFGTKKSGGKIECLIERVLGDHRALAHIRSSHAPKIGAEIILEKDLRAIVIERQESLFLIEFQHSTPIFELLDLYGKIPLPPYITRNPSNDDLSRYQTIYAKHKGAVAAPTAGLHFDEEIIRSLQAKKVDIGFLTLHVGAGTFQPVRTENIADHVMHAENVTISAALFEKIRVCKNRGGRVIAVGTTVVRALESAADQLPSLNSHTFDTSIFITPGFQFKIVDVLLTNFHLPKSTLLMLVSAFAGYDRIMKAYREAVERQYRFFSYGDAMLLHRKAQND